MLEASYHEFVSAAADGPVPEFTLLMAVEIVIHGYMHIGPAATFACVDVKMCLIPSSSKHVKTLFYLCLECPIIIAVY